MREKYNHIMKVSQKMLQRIIKEVYEDSDKEYEILQASENLASTLSSEWSKEEAYKIIVYAADILIPGSYRPSEVEKDEFISEPFPGSRKIPGGSLSWRDRENN